jgi:Carbohydrate binding domain
MPMAESEGTRQDDRPAISSTLTSQSVAPTIGELFSSRLMAPIKVVPMNNMLTFSLVLFFPVVAFAEDAKNLLKPVNKAESWRLEQHEGAQATLKISDDAAVFNATKLTGTNWHIQVFQVDLDLKEGKKYTLKLKLTASQRRNVMLVAMIDADDWHEIGLHEDLTVDREVRSLEFTFRATGILAKKNRIGFLMGDETGDLIVREMTLTEKEDKI